MQAVASKLIGMGIPIKYKSLHAVLRELPRVKDARAPASEELIDIRRLVFRLPLSMRRVIDSWLAMKVSVEKRGKRRRSTQQQHQQQQHAAASAAAPAMVSNYGDNNASYANYSNYGGGGGGETMSKTRTGMMASLRLDASLPARSRGGTYDDARVGRYRPCRKPVLP